MLHKVIKHVKGNVHLVLEEVRGMDFHVHHQVEVLTVASPLCLSQPRSHQTKSVLLSSKASSSNHMEQSQQVAIHLLLVQLGLND